MKKTIYLGLLLLTGLIFTACREKAFNLVQKTPASAVNILSDHLTENLVLSNCYSIPSENYPGSYIAAGEITGEKMKGSVLGIWILDKLDSPENIFSISQAAIAFSDFEPAKNNRPLARYNKKDAVAVRKYIEKKYYKRED